MSSNQNITNTSYAEKYLTDQQYDVGTVLSVGGSAELTASMANALAIGVVVSDDSADSQTISLKGRAQVLVSGPVNKGDGLTAGDFGTAIAAYDERNSPEPTAGLLLQRIFAVALESTDTSDATLIECIIL